MAAEVCGVQDFGLGALGRRKFGLQAVQLQRLPEQSRADEYRDRYQSSCLRTWPLWICLFALVGFIGVRYVSTLNLSTACFLILRMLMRLDAQSTMIKNSHLPRKPSKPERFPEFRKYKYVQYPEVQGFTDNIIYISRTVQNTSYQRILGYLKLKTKVSRIICIVPRNPRV